MLCLIEIEMQSCEAQASQRFDGPEGQGQYLYLN
jgi:hypothetical protein